MIDVMTAGGVVAALSVCASGTCAFMAYRVPHHLKPEHHYSAPATDPQTDRPADRAARQSPSTAVQPDD